MASSSAPSASSAPAGGAAVAPIQFQPFSSAVDISFWSSLGSNKLDVYRLDRAAIEVEAGFAPGTHEQIPSQLCLGSYSFPPAAGEASSPSAAYAPPHAVASFGRLHNANTSEEFKSFPVAQMIADAGGEMFAAIKRHLQAPDAAAGESITRVLSRFLLLSFADLKTHRYAYWFAMPALVFEGLAFSSSGHAMDQPASADMAREIEAFLKQHPVRSSSGRLAGHEGFFALLVNPVNAASVPSVTIGLDDALGRALAPGQKVVYAFVDPSPLANNMGWPARNLLTYLALRGVRGVVKLISYRGAQPSRVFECSIDCALSSAELLAQTPKIVGWEKNAASKLAPRVADLGALMDPVRLAEESANLNLKLMRWRALPALDLGKLGSVKCLLLGSGTLGCNVARCLLGWGVRHITFLDSGRVSYSNPVRQSLFQFEDCKEGGRPKAEAAAEALKRIYPLVDAQSVHMAIPMPGHTVSPAEEKDVLADIVRLTELIRLHDAVFLLTDSRESRWLPTLLAAAHNKIAMNTALGFDTFVVMRHGDNWGGARRAALAAAGSLSPDDSASSASALPASINDSNAELGCYFCNDVIAPTDSLSDRTLDQQCTVTRPGLAFMSSALVVELFVSLLHHPLRQHAPADLDNASASSATSGSSGFGLVPHQLRGFLARYNTTLVVGHAFGRCTACSKAILDAYAAGREQFVLQALNQPTKFLEDISGLTQMKADTEAMFKDMADADDAGREDDPDADDF